MQRRAFTRPAPPRRSSTLPISQSGRPSPYLLSNAELKAIGARVAALLADPSLTPELREHRVLWEAGRIASLAGPLPATAYLSELAARLSLTDIPAALARARAIYAGGDTKEI